MFMCMLCVCSELKQRALSKCVFMPWNDINGTLEDGGIKVFCGKMGHNKCCLTTHGHILFTHSLSY